MGVAFFFGVFLLVLSEDAEGDWSACRNLHLLPNVQVPFCQFQYFFLFGSSWRRAPFTLPSRWISTSTPTFLTLHFGIIDLLRMTVKTLVTFVTSSFVEEVIAENLLLVNRWRWSPLPSFAFLVVLVGVRFRRRCREDWGSVTLRLCFRSLRRITCGWCSCFVLLLGLDRSGRLFCFFRSRCCLGRGQRQFYCAFSIS